MKDKHIGKIESAEFGLSGYQDRQLGLSLTFGSSKEGWGCGTFKGFWDTDMKRSNDTQWTEKDREKGYSDAVRLLGETLSKAKKNHVAQLVGVPVEVTFENNTIKSWRILEEVL